MTDGRQDKVDTDDVHALASPAMRSLEQDGKRAFLLPRHAGERGRLRCLLAWNDFTVGAFASDQNPKSLR